MSNGRFSMGGKPIIRGMRISVELILSLLAKGETEDAILADYPDLAREDLRACLTYAHAVIAQDSLDAVQGAVRFLIDRCAGRRLADWLRDHGHDVVESRDRGPDPGDRVLLEWSVSERRILVTMDKILASSSLSRMHCTLGSCGSPMFLTEGALSLWNGYFAATYRTLKAGQFCRSAETVSEPPDSRR